MKTLAIICLAITGLLFVFWLIQRQHRLAVMGQYLYRKLDEACVEDIHLAAEKGLISAEAQGVIGKGASDTWTPRHVENIVLLLASPLAIRLVDDMPPGPVKRAMMRTAKPIADQRAFMALERSINIDFADVHAMVLAAHIRHNSPN